MPNKQPPTGENYRYGVFVPGSRKFAFGICEETPQQANRKLRQRIGNHGYRYRLNREIKLIRKGSTCAGGFAPQYKGGQPWHRCRRCPYFIQNQQGGCA